MINRLSTRAYCLLLLTLCGFAANAQLVAKFSASPVTGCAPLLVNFSDQSTGTPTQWKWDLGNGTISFLQNPSVSYFNPGFYSIKLIVKNGANIDSVIKTQLINVSAKPIAQFSASATAGCYPLPVQFSDNSSAGNDTLKTWQWDFGDGYSSGSQNPLHVYTAAGNFTVTLRVINSKGCLNTVSKNQYIQVNPGAKAIFSNSVPNVCSAPVNINFHNLSTGAGLSYEWLFGDGSGSAQQNPSHQYNTPGTFTVKLIATTALGCKDTSTKADAFIIGSVSASFSTGNKICAGMPLLINNTSTPAPSSVNFSFGDGTSSTQISPVKIFTTPGTYQIKLVANFGSCLDSSFKTVTVMPGPAAAFNSDDSAKCGFPFTVNFTNHALNAVSWKWDFGDNSFSSLPDPGHTYTSYGNFNVQLVVTSVNGCTDTIKKINYVKIVKPVTVLTNLPDSGCVPFTKYFSSTTTSLNEVTGYSWDFGDGSASTNATPTHLYTRPGIYTVRLVITTAGGCTDTVIMPRAIVTNSRPKAAFTATPREACAKTGINFTDQSAGNPSKWLWEFGDGTTSASKNPQHIYSDTGYFDVQLIVWNSGCPDTVRYAKYVHINPPVARFIESFDCARPLERSFANISIGADAWSWDFGDGHSSTQFSPVHTYAIAGYYNVSLTVWNHLSGCDFTTIKNIQVVNANSSFFASDTIFCKGSSVNFISNASLAEVKLFSWDFGDGKTAIAATSNSIAHLYTAPGNYTTRLITTNVLGCTDTLMKPAYLRINGPTANFTPSITGTCLNTNISFNDSSISDGIHAIKSWSWNYGDSIQETSYAAPFKHQYKLPGAFTVTLKVTDTKGCADSIKIASPLIISKPAALFTPVDSISCPASQVRFANQSTGPGLGYQWNFGDGNVSDIQNPVHAYSTNGSYTVKLSVRDQYGCTDSITKTGIISVVTPHANFIMSDSFSTCPPLIVQFTNLSVNADSQSWDFGDGNTSIVRNASHFYNFPGTYTVTLTVTARGGCTDIIKKNILVNGPKGTFVYDPVSGCNPVKINFIASTSDKISFIWDFSDGATVSTGDSIISHQYTNPGIYLPKMILVDANGCQVPYAGKDTINVSGVTAKFVFADKVACDRGTISFIDSSVSNDIITGYKWSLGDGSKSTIQDPQHQYTSPGLYYPKLVVTTMNGCVDSMLSAKPVKVVASPQINFTSTANGCTPLAVTFKGLVTVPDTAALSWHWVFGNGDSGSVQNPVTEKYTTAGIYNPSLIVTNSSGCTDTAVNTIEAFIVPQVSAGHDTIICSHTAVTLHATGADIYKWNAAPGLSCLNCASPVATPDSAINYIVKGTSLKGCSANDTMLVKLKYPFRMKYSKADTLCKGQNRALFASGTDRYQWTPPTGLNNSNIATPVATPDTTINYRVVGTDFQGCYRDTGYVSMKVYPIPTVSAGPDKKINIGQTIDLVPVISPDVTTVTWTPTGNIFRNTFPAISVKPNETTNYTVEVKNGGGCAARGSVTVYVICNGSNVFIPNTFSPNGDGANDVFYPRGTGLFKIKTLRVFNRWGEIVFEKNGFSANDPAFGWDGTYKGVKLGADVFVYMIDIVCDNNTVLTYKGNVALIQ